MKIKKSTKRFLQQKLSKPTTQKPKKKLNAKGASKPFRKEGRGKEKERENREGEGEDVLEFDDLVSGEGCNEEIEFDSDEDVEEVEDGEDEEDDFGFQSDASELSDDDQNDDENENDKDNEEQYSKRKPLTQKTLDSWKTQELDHYMRQLLTAFHSIVYQHDTDTDTGKKEQVAYEVDTEMSSQILHELFHNVGKFETIFFPNNANNNTSKNNTSNNTKSPTTSSKWKSWKQKLKTFLLDIPAYLELNADNDTRMLVLSLAIEMVRYLNLYPKMVGRYVKSVVALWSSTAGDTNNDTDSDADKTGNSTGNSVGNNGGGNGISTQSLIVIHKIAATHYKSSIALIQKQMFLQFAKSCKNVTLFNQSKMQFMINSMEEFFVIGRDGKNGKEGNYGNYGKEGREAGYQLLFKVVRQFAVHLRNAIANKTKEFAKKVFCWQFVCCFRFMAQVLGKICSETKPQTGKEDDNMMKLLVYPVCQIVLGALEFQINSGRFHPFHFHCCSILTQIVLECEVYVPVHSYLLQIITAMESRKSQTFNSALKPIDFSVNYKVSKGYIGTKVYHDCVYDEAIYLLTGFLSAVGCRLSFPDLIIPLNLQLKQISKQTKNPKLKKIIAQLIEKTTETSSFIDAKRNSLNINPTEREKVREVEETLKREGKCPIVVYFGNCRKVRGMKTGNNFGGSNGVNERKNKKEKNNDDLEEMSEEEETKLVQTKKEKKSNQPFNKPLNKPTMQKQGKHTAIVAEPAAQNSKKRKQELQKKNQKKTQKKNVDGDGQDDIVEDFVMSDQD